MMTCGETGVSTADEGPAEFGLVGSDTRDPGEETRRTLVIQSGSWFPERVHVWVIETVREWTRLPKEKKGMDKPSEAKSKIKLRNYK